MIFNKVRNLGLHSIASLAISISVAVILCSTSISGSRLNSDGGYDLLLAIEESTPRPPMNPLIYFTKMRLILQTLSNSLYSSTNKKFFINSIDFLVPEHWGLLGFDATTHSYETADIRVSDKFQYFRAENPNSCGLPGKYIEAPMEFFQDSSWTSKFGTPWKALITQWARYRWGVWEEHGYPGDSRFPYFYQQPGQDGWTTTGCSDVPINGTFMTIENKTCEVGTSEYPGDDCRLFPDWEFSSATTSLMNFHWIENVLKFCDESSHVRDSPNRQNRNCGHRSVWEVIRETPDYKFVTEPGPIMLPILQMYIYAASKHPRLYVLLDRGGLSESNPIHRRVYHEINQLVTGGKIYGENVAKITSFPHVDPSNPADILKTEVEWSYVQESQPFQDALSNLSGANNSSGRRDYASAIQTAVEELIEKNNPAGSILIVVKTGTAKSSFATIGYEQDTLATLQENPRIKVYSIEILGKESESENLLKVSATSGGKHVSIVNADDIQSKLTAVLDEIARLCITVKTPEPLNSAFANVYRGYLQPNQVNEIPVQITTELEQLQLHITTNTKLRPEQFFIQPSTATRRSYRTVRSTLPSIYVREEWSEGTDPSRRYIYSVIISSIPEITSESWKIYYECDASVSDCTGLLHIDGRKKMASSNLSPDDSTSSGVDSNIGLEIDLSIATRNVDMTNTGLALSSPFTIYASVHKYGQPVTNVHVAATIQNLESNGSWTLALTDDGLGAPDLYHNDGIYSAAFIPPQDGRYKIFAFVKSKHCKDEKDGQLKNSIQLLLPDQKNIGCFPNNKDSNGLADAACVGTEVQGSYGKVVFLPGIVHVANAANIVLGQPFRTLDLQASVDTLARQITLTFIAPRLLGTNDKGTSYTIYHSNDSRDLIGDVDESLKLASYPTNPPGTVEVIRIQPRTANLMYYAIQTHYGSVKSGPSNIIALKLDGDFSEEITPTPKQTVKNLTTITSAVNKSDLDSSGQAVRGSSSWGQHPNKVLVAVVLGSFALIAAMGFVSFKIMQAKQGKGKSSDTTKEPDSVSQSSHRIQDVFSF